MNLDPQTVTQTIDQSITAKGAVISGGVGPTVYLAAQTPCEISYLSPHVLVPLTVSILTGIWIGIQIYEKLKKINK